MLYIAIALLFAATPFASPLSVDSDLDSDGRIERIILDPQKTNSLSIWRNGRKLWEGVPSKWKPFKMRVANLDGLRVKSIVLGVFKSTRFFPKAHNCLFVYGWDEKRDEAFERWLGSSLSKPYFDFDFVRVGRDSHDTLVSIERLNATKKCVMAYRWNGFGFDTLWQSKGFDRIEFMDHGRLGLNGVPYRISRDGSSFQLKHDNTR